MAEEPTGSAPTQEPKPTDDVLRMTKSQVEDYITKVDESSKDFDLEKMHRLITGDRVEIIEEESAETPQGEPAPAPEKPTAPQETPTEPVAPQEPAPPKPEPDKGQPDVEALQKRAEWLSQERDKATSQYTDLEKKFKDLEGQIEALKKAPADDKTPAPEKKEIQKLDVGESKMTEIKQLRKEIADMPLDDKMSGTEDYLKKVERLNELNVYEQERLGKVVQSLQTTQNPELREVRDLLEAQKKEIEELRAADKKREEDMKANEAKIQQQRQLEAVLKEVEDFQTKHENFKTSKPLLEAEKDYMKWAHELAYLKYNRYATTQEEVSAAVAAFQNQDPTLVQKVGSAGLQKPSDVDTYMDLMDVWRIRKSLPPVNGKPATFESALKYRMNETGETDQAILAAKKAGVEMTKKAMEPSPTAARQLPPHSEGSPEEVTGEMTEEQAKAIVTGYSALDAYKNPKLQKQFQDAMRVLKFPEPMVELLKTK